MKSLLKRFFNKVKITEKCWEWSGCTTKGYGEFAIGNKKQVRAHRFSYELFKGKIPEGLHIDHLCRNTICVNPRHLEAVTPRENFLRGISPPVSLSKRTHCNNGHEFTEENTYIRNGSHGRNCRACERIRNKKRRHNDGFSSTHVPTQ